MAIECDRCGEEIKPQYVTEQLFSVGYKPLGIDAPDWRILSLCTDCQHDLRTEFYRRGLTRREDNARK